MIWAAGLRRSVPGSRADRAPCRTRRGAPRSPPPRLRGVYYLQISQPPGSASAHTPRPPALRPRSASPRRPRASPPRSVGGGRAGAKLRLPSPAVRPAAPVASANLCVGLYGGKNAHVRLVKEEPRPEEHAAQIKGRRALRRRQAGIMRAGPGS